MLTVREALTIPLLRLLVGERAPSPKSAATRVRAAVHLAQQPSHVALATGGC